MIRAAISGRLGADPIVRTTRNDKAMTTVSIAVDVGRTGEQQTEWVGLVAFGAVGGLLARHAKGNLVTVMGAMTKSLFTGRDGEEKSVWSVLVEALLSVRSLRTDKPKERRASNGSSRARAARPPKRAPYRPQLPGHVRDLPNDDVTDLYA